METDISAPRTAQTCRHNTSSEVELMETAIPHETHAPNTTSSQHFFGSGINGNLGIDDILVTALSHNTSSEVELMET